MKGKFSFDYDTNSSIFGCRKHYETIYFFFHFGITQKENFPVKTAIAAFFTAASLMRFCPHHVHVDDEPTIPFIASLFVFDLQASKSVKHGDCMSEFQFRSQAYLACLLPVTFRPGICLYIHLLGFQAIWAAD
jgi:hypothetical protein